MSTFQFHAFVNVEAKQDDYENATSRAKELVDALNRLAETEGAGLKLGLLEPEQLPS